MDGPVEVPVPECRAKDSGLILYSVVGLPDRARQPTPDHPKPGFWQQSSPCWTTESLDEATYSQMGSSLFGMWIEIIGKDMER